MTRAHAFAMGVVLGAWWLSTAIVLGLVWLGAKTRRRTMLGATVVGAVGVLGVVLTREQATVAGVYLALASSLAVWAWHELSFLQGVVTGPWKTVCPPDATGWRRFKLATLAVIHHELALAATLALLVGLTWGAANQVATGTYVVLWAMRLSAKLNLFFGVRNLSEDFIPQHLQYLRTFFRRATMNPLLPLSVLIGLVATVWFGHEALDPTVSEVTQLGRTLVVTMLALGVLEHIFLAVPLGDGALWRWVIRARARAAETPL